MDKKFKRIVLGNRPTTNPLLGVGDGTFEEYAIRVPEIISVMNDNLDSLRDYIENLSKRYNQLDKIYSAESVRVANEEERISKDSERDSKIEVVEGLQADLISGAVDSAAVQQHVEERYGQLEEEYAPKLTEVTTQLADKAALISRSYERNEGNYIVPTAKPTKAYITFVDDDGSKAVLDKLLPLFSSKGVPCTLAVNVDNTNLYSLEPLTIENLLDLQNNHGWEIANHGYNHINFSTLTGDALHHEIVACHDYYTSKGVKMNGVVYPFGSNSLEAIEISKKYHQFGVVAGGGLVQKPLRTFNIPRVAFGSFTGTGEDTYEFYKSKVDEAIANNQWLIFMTHAWHEDHDTTQQQHLENIIDYCIANNVEIVTLSDGYKVFGNIEEVAGEYVVTNQGEKIPLKVTGEYKIISDDTVNFNTPQTYFKPYTETITKIHSTLGNTVGFPITNGILRTLAPGFTEGGGAQYVTQILTGYGGGMYYRVRLHVSSWTNFYRIGLPSSIVATTDTEIVLPANGFKAFNVTVSPLVISTSTPFIVTPKTPMNAEIVYSAKRNTQSSVTITLHNLTATERNLGIMEWVVKALE